MSDTAIRLIAFALAVAPAVFLTFYVWARRTHPIGGEFAAVALGFGASVGLLAVGIEVLEFWVIGRVFANLHLRSFFEAFVVAGLTEEAVKFVALYYVVMRHEECRTPLDILYGAILVGLGFAALENVFYVVGEEGWRRIGMLRSFTSVPGHAVMGILLGFFAALAKIHDESRRRFLTTGVVVAVLFHGFYDWPLLAISDMEHVTGATVAYWCMFTGLLLTGGIIAMRCLESPSIHRHSPSGTQFWTPPPIFWRLIGICIAAAGICVPAFWYDWRHDGWKTVFIVFPIAILPVIFGTSLFRQGGRFARTR